MEDLRQQAEALGLAVDGRWSEETLRAKIEEAGGSPVSDQPKTLAELNAEQREIDKAIGGYRGVNRSGRRVQKILRAQVK